MGTKVRKKTMKMPAWVKLAKSLRDQRPWINTPEYITAMARAATDRNIGDKQICTQFEMMCLGITDMLEQDDPAFKNCKREFFATCGLERCSQMDAIKLALSDPDVRPWA